MVAFRPVEHINALVLTVLTLWGRRQAVGLLQPDRAHRRLLVEWLYSRRAIP
jgi:hypothetical protein